LGLYWGLVQLHLDHGFLQFACFGILWVNSFSVVIDWISDSGLVIEHFLELHYTHDFIFGHHTFLNSNNTVDVLSFDIIKSYLDREHLDPWGGL
jgi:hypothetical protein